MKKQKSIKVTNDSGGTYTLLEHRMQNKYRYLRREDVKRFFRNRGIGIDAYSRNPYYGDYPDNFQAYRNGDGTIEVGCQVFTRETVAVIRKWAMAYKITKKKVKRAR